MPNAITPEEQALLDAIAGPESRGSWNIIYGGHRFDNYSDHPRQYVTIKSGPNKGQKSSAAGKYQITAKTYDQVAPKLGITDFSPESQQRIALYLAREKYGPGLQTALENGQIGKVAKKLSGVWTSLPGGIEATTSTHHVASAYNRALSSIPSTSALDAIDQIAPPLPRARPDPGIASAFAAPAPLAPSGIHVASVFPNGQTIDASPPLPRPRPNPVMPPQMAQLDPLLASGRLNASTGVSGGTNLFRGIPGINDATTIAPSVGTRALPPPKVTFTGNGFSAQPTPFQQNNAAAVMAGLPFGIGTAAQGLGNIGGFISSLGQAKASPTPPPPSTPVPTQSQMQAIRAVPPQYTTKAVQVLNPAYTAALKAGQAYTPTGSIVTQAQQNAFGGLNAPKPVAPAPLPPKYITQTTRVPVPTVPVRAPAAFPLTSFNTVNPLSQIGPGIASQFGTSPMGHLFQLFSGEPVSGGLLGMLQNNMPSLPHPSMIPSGPAPGSNFLQAQGINTQGMTAGEQANALRNAMGGSHNGEFH